MNQNQMGFYSISVVINSTNTYIRRSVLGGIEFTTNSDNNKGKFWSFVLDLNTSLHYVVNPDQGYFNIAQSVQGELLGASQGLNTGVLWIPQFTFLVAGGIKATFQLSGTNLFLGLDSNNQPALVTGIGNATSWDVILNEGGWDDNP